MEDRLRIIKPTEGIELMSKDYPKRQQKYPPNQNDENSSKQSCNEKNDNSKNENSKKDEKENVSREDVKRYMESCSKSQLYKLMSIMNNEGTSTAIEYLAELAKKSSKRKSTEEKYKEYDR